MRVLLEREPHLQNKLFKDERRPAALSRAQSLATLHGCRYTEETEDAAFIVHASAYYEPKDPGAYNADLDAHLTELGYKRTWHPDSFEDDGDGESGPHLTGGPAFDEYEDATERVIIDEKGHAVHRELRDLEMEKFIEANMPDGR
jgi:hypothetical protein